MLADARLEEASLMCDRWRLAEEEAVKDNRRLQVCTCLVTGECFSWLALPHSSVSLSLSLLWLCRMSVVVVVVLGVIVVIIVVFGAVGGACIWS